MALTTKKSITLTGQSEVSYGTGKVIAQHFTKNLSDEANTNAVSTVVNKDAYEANIDVCREDEDAFTKWVREVEDDMKAKAEV